MGEVAHGAHHVHAGAHVVQAGEHPGDGGLQGLLVQCHHQHGEDGGDAVEHHVAVGVVDDALVHQLAVHVDLGHLPGPDDPLQAPPAGLEQQQHPGRLDAPAGGPGAGPHDHQRHQDHLGEGGPQVEVRGGKARGGHNGGHLEGRVVQRLAQVPVILGGDVPGDEGGGPGHDPQVEPKLLVVQHLAELPQEHQVVDAEIHPEQRHEYGAHRLQVSAVPCHAVVLDGKAAGARRAEGDGQRVEQGHATQQQQGDLDEGHGDIDGIEDLGAFLQGGHQLVHLGAGALGPHHVQQGVAPLAHGHHRQQEHQHPHAPQPVGKAAPVQQPLGHGLHIR